MGQAFDREGRVLGEATGETKREVFDKLISEFKDAHEIRIQTLENTQAGADHIEGITTTRRLVGETVEAPRQCCERDDNHDGNCDRHPAGRITR